MRYIIPMGLFVAALFILAWVEQARPQDLSALLKAEAERVEVIKKIKPTAVAVFARGGKGGGSGVLISDDGYALTNFHVVQAAGPTMQCGLADGILYDAVIVGLDKVGDVSLIKLLPKKEGQKFPFAVLGDSDKVHEGDWSMALGNPFLLATDFTPTVTFGLVSGVHRYQPPAGIFLEYTECIQIDASINPGNSGGPLFNMQGELIGINGRGSFDKRGRVNSGVGYAISINQIKNFLGHLRAGLDTDHASLGAVVTTQTETGGPGRMLVTSMLEDCDAARRGLDLDDEILSFAGQPITSVNHFKNELGIYPRGWRLPLEFRRELHRTEILVRLMGVQRKLVGGGEPDSGPGPRPGPGGPKIGGPLGPQGPAAKLYEPRPGFANYYFNRLERDRLLASFKKHGDFKSLAGNWVIEGTIRLKKLRTESKAKISITEEKEGNSLKPVVVLTIDSFNYTLEPTKEKLAPETMKLPESSGGLLSAMHLYRLFLTEGEKAFSGEFFHGGYEPFYPPPLPTDDAKAPEASLASRRVETEVIVSRSGAYLAKWFFARTDQKLLGLEVRLEQNEDPCEVYFYDYRPVDGRMLPHRMQVVYGNGHYGSFTFTKFQMAAAK